MDTPIVLESFFYKKLNITWRDGIKEESTPFEINFSFDIKTKKDDPKHILMTLGVEVFPEKNFRGVHISTTIDGFFAINESCDKGDSRGYALVNASTILYGLFRGQLSMITSNFPDGKIMLPTVMMLDEIKKFYSQQSKSEVTSKAKIEKKNTIKK